MAIDAARLQVTVEANTAPAEKGLQSFSKSMQGHARSLGAVSAGMSLGITAPLLGIAQGALSLAADFEKSMNVLEAVTGAPAAAMQALNDQALQLGKDTIFSANEAAEGMLELAKAGMTTEQVAAAIPGVMNLAAAGEMSLADAANITTGALNAFSLEASESTRIADMYAAAANASTASMTDLAQGGRQAGFAFAASGQPIDDMVTSLAILTSNGLTGSDAGTALKNMMVQLMSPTKKATKIMKELGINVFDVNGEMLSTPDIIAEFTEGLAGLTEEQRLYNLENILGSDGMKAMQPLLTAGTAGFADMKAAVNEQGAAAKIAQALTEGLGGAIEYIGGSIATFLTTTALPFTDFLSDIIRSVADFISGLSDLPQPVINAALAFGAVLAAAGPLIGVAAAVAFALSALGTAAAPILLVVGAVAALAAGIAYLDSIGVIDLGAMWTTAKTKIDEAITAVGRWKDQISTQGLISEETFLASFELPAAWREILQFTIGMGAAVKVLGGAVTGVEPDNIAELNGILQSAFGSEIATRISNIATHITTLKEALSGATSVGDWLTGLGTFASSMGTEIEGIAKEINTQIKAKLEELDFKITIGAANITWNEDIKAMTVGPFKAIITPDLTQVTVGTQKLLEIRAKPDFSEYLVSAPGITLKTTPDFSEWEAAAGPLHIQVTPEFTQVNVEKIFNLKVGAGNQIELTLGAGDFKVDLSPAIAKLQGEINSLQTEISAAFETGGWSGLGALAIEKITQIGTDIGAAFAPMVTLAQLGLVLATGQVATEINKHFGEGATFDLSSVGAWAQRQADAAKAQLDAVFGEDNMGSRMIERAEATVGKITEAMAGFGDMSAMERFNAGVESVLAVFGLISGFKTEALTAVSTTLTTLATSIAGFATTIIAGLDANMLASTLKGAAKGMSEAIVIAFAPENLGDLGKAAGGLVSAIVTKLGELLGADKFGEDVGAAVGDATVAIAKGALALAEGFTTELGKLPWTQFGANVNSFVDGFILAAITSLATADFSGIGQALLDGVVNSFTKAREERNVALEKEKQTPDEPRLNWEEIIGGFLPDLSWMTEPSGTGFFGIPPETSVTITGYDVLSSAPPPQTTVTVDSLTIAPGVELPIAKDAVPLTGALMDIIPTATPPKVDVQPVIAGSGWNTFLPQAPPEVPVTAVITDTRPIQGPLTEVEVMMKPQWPSMQEMMQGIQGAASGLSDMLSKGLDAVRGAGGDTPMSVRVEAASVTAAAGMQPLQTDAIIAHVEQPSPIPTINVRANITNPGDLKADGSGLANAGAAAGAAISSSMSGFKWPQLPPWDWPAYNPFDWPAYPPFDWPPIPRPGWISELRIPRPSWIGELLSWSPSVRLEVGSGVTTPGATGGGATTGLAGGTSYWRGGTALVGESGREIVQLPRGSRVHNNRDTEAMLAGNNGVTVQFTGPITISNDMDLNTLADKLTYLITQKQNRRG